MESSKAPLSDLTVVLVLKDRLEFTERWIRFNLMVRPKFKTLIADGSTTPIVDKSLLAQIESLGAEYLYFGPDKDLSIMTNKIHHALSYCKTKYVVLSSNDDFYLSRGMSKSITFLDSNPEYVSCSGRIQNFSVLPSENRIVPYGGSLFLGDELYPGRGLTDDSPLKRVKEFLSQDESFWHSVFRTDYLLATYDEARKQSNEDFILYDLFVNLHLSLAGKHSRLRNSYSMLHQVHDEMEARNLVSKNSQTEYWWESVTLLVKTALEKFNISTDFYLLEKELDSFRSIGNEKSHASHRALLRSLVQRAKYKYYKTKVKSMIDLIDPMTSMVARDLEVSTVRRFLKEYV
jgi:glycosyltransferase domain-containing protein